MIVVGRSEEPRRQKLEPLGASLARGHMALSVGAIGGPSCQDFCPECPGCPVRGLLGGLQARSWASILQPHYVVCGPEVPDTRLPTLATHHHKFQRYDPRRHPITAQGRWSRSVKTTQLLTAKEARNSGTPLATRTHALPKHADGNAIYATYLKCRACMNTQAIRHAQPPQGHTVNPHLSCHCLSS